MSENLDSLYRDIIMEHYKYPRGKKKLEDPDVTSEGKNPVCGDEIGMKVKLKDGKIEDISIDCLGCAISVASGSMLADAIKGKSIEEVKRIASAIKAILKGEKPDEDFDLGDLEALEGVSKFPVRIKCALLSWTTLVEGLETWESGKKSEIATTE
ncbi:MAG: SUF system NifU family Fe-S cluster assembly protein [Candidatus Zixiibacteriota bacterium]|nr:MAG: SUF system NifU family Fe-S cluster assembly protein [candidate division Zixibacteria bacterium]